VAVSGEGRAEPRVPEPFELVLGFRLWEIDADGVLRSLAFREAWDPGANEAICRIEGTEHAAPHAGCGCGFTALHFPPLGADEVGDPGHALGAIGAWGEVEVNRTGFRAQNVTVLLLARPREAGAAHLEKLERAAERYGVELVPANELRERAQTLAMPISRSLLPEARPPEDGEGEAEAAEPVEPEEHPGEPLSIDEVSGAGVWLERHVAVQCDAGVMRVGPTPALAPLLAGLPTVRLRAEENMLMAGEPIWVVGLEGDAYAVRTPATGLVREVNYTALAHPEQLESGPSADGWVAELDLMPAPLDYSQLLWGRSGAETYRSYVLELGSDRTVLDQVRVSEEGPERGALMLRRRAESHGPGRSEAGPVDPESQASVRAVSDNRQLIEAIGGVRAEELRLE
jgi:glycine cleavage system H lipoate-binding protein